MGATVWAHTGDKTWVIHAVIEPMLQFAEPDETGYLPTPYEMGAPGEMTAMLEKHGFSEIKEENVRHLDFRLCLMSGLRNAIFPPAGITRTFEWLDEIRKRRPTPLEDLFPLPVPAYAHMDCFIGVRAHRDVFPLLAEWLAGNRPKVPIGEDALSPAEPGG